MFCKHKYGKIDNGYQYCEKCGKAIVAPCAHKWKILQEIHRYPYSFGEKGDIPSGIVKIFICERCGITRKETIQ